LNKNTRTQAVIAASVAAVTFAVYLPSLQNGFVWDDDKYVYENPFIRSLDLQLLKAAFLEFHAANWHPLTWLTHAFDYSVWGLNPLGHHLTNNIFHALNASIVVLLTVKLLEAFRKASNGKDLSLRFLDDRTMCVAAAAAGLMFGLHPLHVESAAWVAERKDLLCAFFFMLAVISYIRYAGSMNVRAVIKAAPRFFDKNYLLSLTFFVLSLMSKPMAVTLPVILLLLDWHPLKRIQSIKAFLPVLIEKLPFIVLSLISSIVTVLAQKSEGAIAPLTSMPLLSRVFVAADSIIMYLWKMAVPLNLLPFYPYDPLPVSVGNFLKIVLVVGITATCIVMVKKSKTWLLAWSYYVVTLIPVLGLVQVGHQSMADRYTYLPSLGPFLIAALGAAWVLTKVNPPGKQSAAALAGAAAVVCILVSISYLTFVQIGRWKNSITLWTYVIEKEPGRVPLAYVNRGASLQESGQDNSALADYNMAIALDPNGFEAYGNRGILYMKHGFAAKAIEDFDKAIIINPYEADLYSYRALARASIGQNSAAIDDYSKAIGLNKASPQNYYGRGFLYFAAGSKEQALLDFRIACELGYKSGCSMLQSLGR
jgi:hypothetical protein